MSEQATIQLNITPEMINELVAKALIKSALGEQVLERARKAVEEAFSSRNSYGRNTVVDAVNAVVAEQVQEHLKAHTLPQIQAKIAEAITPEIVAGAVKVGVDKIRQQLSIYS